MITYFNELSRFINSKPTSVDSLVCSVDNLSGNFNQGFMAFLKCFVNHFINEQTNKLVTYYDLFYIFEIKLMQPRICVNELPGKGRNDYLNDYTIFFHKYTVCSENMTWCVKLGIILVFRREQKELYKFVKKISLQNKFFQTVTTYYPCSLARIYNNIQAFCWKFHAKRSIK